MPSMPPAVDTLRRAAARLREEAPEYLNPEFFTAVANWLEVTAQDVGTSTIAYRSAVAAARAYLDDGDARRCPCFLHYHPPRDWKHLSCACECDVPHEEGGAVPRCPTGQYPACVRENSLCTFPNCVNGGAV